VAIVARARRAAGPVSGPPGGAQQPVCGYVNVLVRCGGRLTAACAPAAGPLPPAGIRRAGDVAPRNRAALSGLTLRLPGLKTRPTGLTDCRV